MTRFGVNYGLAETPSIEAKAGNLLHIILRPHQSELHMLPLVILLPLLALLKFLLEFQEKNSPLSSTYCISCYLFHCDARTCCGCTTTPTITILWCGHTHKNDFVEYHYPQKQFCEGNQALQGLVTLRMADLLC